MTSILFRLLWKPSETMLGISAVVDGRQLSYVWWWRAGRRGVQRFPEPECSENSKWYRKAEWDVDLPKEQTSGERRGKAFWILPIPTHSHTGQIYCQVNKAQEQFRAAPSKRTFGDDGKVLNLHGPVWWPLAIHGCWALGMWLVQLRNHTFIEF